MTGTVWFVTPSYKPVGSILGAAEWYVFGWWWRRKGGRGGEKEAGMSSRGGTVWFIPNLDICFLVLLLPLSLLDDLRNLRTFIEQGVFIT